MEDIEEFDYPGKRSISGKYWKACRIQSDFFKVVLTEHKTELDIEEMDTIHNGLLAMGFTSKAMILLIFEGGVSFTDAYRIKAGQIDCKGIGVVPRNRFQSRLLQLLKSVTKTSYPVYFYENTEEAYTDLVERGLEQ